MGIKINDLEMDLNPVVPALKAASDKTKVDIRYPLISPFAFAHIHWNNEQGELIYELEEPVLTEDEKIILQELEEAMRDIINVDVVHEKDMQSLVDYTDKTAKLLVSELSIRLDDQTYNKIFYYLFRDFVGLNNIEAIMKDYFIEDIECNGINTPIYIVHRIYRNIKTNIVYKDVDELASFVEKLAQKSGRYISYANPLLDATLPDGSRINATYTKDITSRGPTFTIRKFTKVPWTPIKLLSFNTLSPEMLAYFWLLVQYRSNILISGGTGSGKTTLLNAIAFFIPPEARVVSIEDTREIELPRENWLPAVARTPISTGQTLGEVDMFSLLKNSFRQNPDYVIVGEVRGKEAFVLFQGMASGHASMSTIHADSVQGVIRRLETPPIELSPSLLETLDAVVIMAHAVVNKKETRRLREVVEIVEITEKGEARVNTPFVWNAQADNFFFKKESVVLKKIAYKYGLTYAELQREFETRTRLIYALYKKNINDFEEVQRIILDYYKDQNSVLKRFGIIP
jgi:archaeal flagellar protein FlaI